MCFNGTGTGISVIEDNSQQAEHVDTFAGAMFAHRLRRWPNIESAMGQSIYGLL